MTTVAANMEAVAPPSHVVILREKLLKTKEDRYIVNIAEALRHSGHHVTILTSEFHPVDCLPELDVS